MEKKKKKGIYKSVQIKHRKVLEKVLENVGFGEAQKMAGYSDGYAEGSQLRKTKSWQDLLEKYLPDELITERIRTVLVDNKEWQAVKAGCELSLKAKGKLEKEDDSKDKNNYVFNIKLTDDRDNNAPKAERPDEGSA